MKALGACRAASSLLGLMLLALNGCNVVGVLAQAMPRDTIPPAYTKLAGQTVVVYVWADRGVRIDWPDIQFNLTSGVQSKLQEAQKADPIEIKDAKFPLGAASVARFQEDHPELESEPITRIAPMLNASRVIYVEISSFQTRSNDSVELYRGSITAIVKVLEVKDGKVSTGFEDRNVAAVFPPKSPEEGVADLSDEIVYQGTIKELATQIAIRFIHHSDEDEQDELDK
jgi:hypothetical protein